MGYRAKTWDGSQWIDLGSNGIDSSVYATKSYVNTAYPGRNLIHNGAFRVWQRGTPITSINSDNTYTADRWYVGRGGLLDVSKGTATPPTGFVNYIKMENKTASNAFIALWQAIETVNVIPHIGKPVTLSFWARANANTAASKSLNYLVMYSTSADTKPSSNLGNSSVTLDSTSWTYVSVTKTIPADAQTLGVQLYSAPGGGLAVNDGLQITGVQLEIGETATAFQHKDFVTELNECQRYYYRHSTGNQPIGTAFFYTASSMYAWIAFPTTMRTAPSINSSTGTDYYLLDRLGAVDYFNSFGQGSKTTAGSWIYNNTEMTSSTAGAAGLVQGYSANSYLGFSADL